MPGGFNNHFNFFKHFYLHLCTESFYHLTHSFFCQLFRIFLLSFCSRRLVRHVFKQAREFGGNCREFGVVCSPGREVGVVCSSGREVGVLCRPGRECGVLCSPGREVGVLCRPRREVGVLCSPGREVGVVCFVVYFVLFGSLCFFPPFLLSRDLLKNCIPYLIIIFECFYTLWYTLNLINRFI